MDIHFEVEGTEIYKDGFKSKIKTQYVKIMSGDKQIGKIKTPSGTTGDIPSAIQVCGFDRAFQLWGCGVFADKKTGKQKQDIQLLYNENSEGVSGKFAIDSDCGRCFNKQKPIQNIIGGKKMFYGEIDSY